MNAYLPYGGILFLSYAKNSIQPLLSATRFLEKVVKHVLTFREKQVFSLRIYYRGDYSWYFRKQLRRMRGMGFTKDELLQKSVDDGMRRWIEKWYAESADEM